MTLRTRFAPSPTGYVHLGNIRTALFAWAFARHHGGEFLLRIEDTDQERSTQAAVDVVLEVMDWLGLNYDNPGDKLVYQMRRMPRYKDVLAQMLADGRAYHCYMQPDELDALREAQMARGEKPRYDGRWRPETGKLLPEPPTGVKPVIRFRNPTTGTVSWQDGVKGRVEIANSELDDLIIARPDGTPTYNFCVVVDDIDMAITHVIRGDDHVNNTPRQINIMLALGATPPIYAHTPTVLGDEEVFTREQLVEWFDVPAISASASRFDPEKFAWINAEHIKRADIERLSADVQSRLLRDGVLAAPLSAQDWARLMDAVMLYRSRVQTLVQLAQEVSLFWRHPQVADALREQHLVPALGPALRDFCNRLAQCNWQAGDIAAEMKAVLTAHGLKMPQLAIPVRVAITGQTQTPSVDAVIWLMGRDPVLARLEAELQRMGA